MEKIAVKCNDFKTAHKVAMKAWPHYFTSNWSPAKNHPQGYFIYLDNKGFNYGDTKSNHEYKILTAEQYLGGGEDVSKREFKVGDEVELIELPPHTQGITLGKVYRVLGVPCDDEVEFEKDNGQITWVYSSRFKLITPKQKEGSMKIRDSIKEVYKKTDEADLVETHITEANIKYFIEKSIFLGYTKEILALAKEREVAEKAKNEERKAKSE